MPGAAQPPCGWRSQPRAAGLQELLLRPLLYAQWHVGTTFRFHFFGGHRCVGVRGRSPPPLLGSPSSAGVLSPRCGLRRASPGEARIPGSSFPRGSLPSRLFVYLGSCCFQAEGEYLKANCLKAVERIHVYGKKKKNNPTSKKLSNLFFQISHFHPQSQHTNLVNVARHTIFPLVILYTQASRMDHKLALYGFNISIASHILCK